MNDLRLPSGILFALLGVILCVMGLFFPEARAPLTSVNVNLFTGLFMVSFGGALLWLARRHS